MGRSIGTPDDVFSGGLGILATGQFAATATGVINAGELCTLHDNGMITRTDPNLPWSSINQNSLSMTETSTTTGPSTSTTIEVEATSIGIENIVVSTSTAVGYCELLLGGNYVVPCQTSAGVGFTIMNSAGNQVRDFILAASDVSSVPPYACALSGGGFVLFWHVSATLKHVVFDLNGNALCSAVVITTVCATSGMVPWHGHCAHNGNKFSVSWSTIAGALMTMMFNGDGTVAVAAFVIDASCSGVNHAHCHCANDDYVVGCFDSGSTLWKLHRCTPGGAHSWGPVYSSSARGSIFGFPDAPHMHHQNNRLVELINNYSIRGYGPPPVPIGGALGGIAIASLLFDFAWVLPHTDGYCKPFIFDHSGNFLRFCDPGPSFRDGNVLFPICCTPQGFAMVHHRGDEPNTYGSFYDCNGNTLCQNVIIDSAAHGFAAGLSPSLACYSAWNGSSLSIVRYAGHGGSCEIRGLSCNGNGGAIGAPQRYQDFSPGDCSAPHPCCSGRGSVFPCWFSSGTLNLTIAVAVTTIASVTVTTPGATTTTTTTIKLSCSSVIGVAAADAVDGGPVTIISEGYFTLPPTQCFASSSSFDQREAPVLGVRGVVGGNAAMLFGWN